MGIGVMGEVINFACEKCKRTMRWCSNGPNRFTGCDTCELWDTCPERSICLRCPEHGKYDVYNNKPKEKDD